MKVLIVDEDPELLRQLSRMLEQEGYTVEVAHNSTETLTRAAMGDLDLVMLDVALGDEDGRELLLELRLMLDVPVIFVTGRGLEKDRIDGLRMGADEYVVKPFSEGELMARIEAVLRRSARGAGATKPKNVDFNGGMRFSGLRIGLRTREVECAGDLVDLTAKEFDLLWFLASSPRQVFSRQQLLEHVWSSSGEWQDEGTVTEHIHRLRNKIESEGHRPRWVTTVRGVGYRFEPEGGQPPARDRRAAPRLVSIS